MAQSELYKARALLRLWAPSKYPANVMGGCTVCASDEKHVHKPRCLWQRTRQLLAVLNGKKA